MESSHRFCSVSIYFNRAIVNLWKSLQLNVISPNSILSFSVDILVEVFFSSHNELHEKLLFTLDVVHAELADNIVIHLVSIVDLVRDSSEHAVAIPFDVSDLHSFVSEESAECVFLIFNFLDSINNYLLLFLTHVSNLLLQLVSRFIILL
jgi:hypothetical protein